MKVVYWTFALMLLIYMFLPGPRSINSFSALPYSVKSRLDGDTWQVFNVAAYFSNDYRSFVVDYYLQNYKNLTWLPFKPFKLIYPPEFAFTAIKDQTQSTYLEEFVYPLRNSLFVNGLEPLYPDGSPKYEGAIKFILPEGIYNSKVTSRYYYSTRLTRILVWAGIIVSLLLLWKISRRVIFNA